MGKIRLFRSIDVQMSSHQEAPSSTPTLNLLFMCSLCGLLLYTVSIPYVFLVWIPLFPWLWFVLKRHIPVKEFQYKQNKEKEVPIKHRETLLLEF